MKRQHFSIIEEEGASSNHSENISLIHDIDEKEMKKGRATGMSIFYYNMII